MNSEKMVTICPFLKTTLNRFVNYVFNGNFKNFYYLFAFVAYYYHNSKRGNRLMNQMTISFKTKTDMTNIVIITEI